jgi:HK97 family phage major capsid protein
VNTLLKNLTEELDQNVARRQAIREAHKGAVLPEQVREEFDQLTKRAEAITGLIEVERQKENDALLQKHVDYHNNPKLYVSHPVNNDDAGLKTLRQAGWEVKGGYWTKQTAFGDVRMYPEEVFAGPLPDDAYEAAYVKQTRAIIQPEYRDAWLKWFRYTVRSGGQDARAMLSGAEQKALSEGIDERGGFTVPPDFQAEIGGRRAQASVMRRLATVRSTMRDSWRRPMIKPNSTAATRNIYTDDFVAAWVGETPSQASIDVEFELFEISVKKLRAFTLLSNDLIADSVGALISELSGRGGRALGLKEDEGFIAGAGTTLEPSGILSHPLALTLVSSNGMAYDVEGTTANTISNTTTDAGSAPKIKQLVYRLPSQYAGNARWLMRRTVQGAVAGLVDNAGRPFWNSYLESGFGRPAMVIEGFPVENSEFVGADGSVSTGPATIPLIFGDFSEYTIVERQQLSVRVLQERFGDTDQTGLFLWSRVGGGLWNYDAIRTGIIAS